MKANDMNSVANGSLFTWVSIHSSLPFVASIRDICAFCRDIYPPFRSPISYSHDLAVYLCRNYTCKP
eukprot:1372814-Amorphochlora_amoeboformis.AAC.1